MITAIIIDDEQNAREFLQKLLVRYFPKKIAVLEICDSVATGVEAINRFQPSLVFLDIQMPDENGFGLFKYFNKINFDVVFTTAYKDYAIDAIKHSALDYLLKPINYIDLLSTIKRFEENDKIHLQNERISLLLQNISSDNSSFNKIALPTQNGYELVKLNSIVYCQSDSNYCKIICADGKELLMAKTLKFVEELLNSDLFIRIHKSYLVNLNFVVNFVKGDELLITLINGEKLPVSFRKKEQFLNAILHKK
ncbi:two component transcriptional regulator, LytTR family [Flavobacterium gillisiae]|uniref:Two component transcriptional regulator, LytTR family n=1 Tax=Flavobacterium gillisiae TaxID=150146 RepID=A0A1H4GDH8_9FLAO|nr:LytTR family DNA-binding domain-containing protein [Flavobacterium gillisiae]SEB07331.1 two component transcriptional regulator, LytTR family [Flavobacterium gillisiae]